MPIVWSDTLLLMGLGMGTVFVFLLILIISLTIMSAVIKKISPVAEESVSQSDIAAVAAAAYQLHQKKSHR